MVSTEKLEALKMAVNEAHRTSKRLDRCHASYIAKTKNRFSRAATTTYNANAASLSGHLKSELDIAKQAAIDTFNM